MIVSPQRAIGVRRGEQLDQEVGDLREDSASRRALRSARTARVQSDPAAIPPHDDPASANAAAVTPTRCLRAYLPIRYIVLGAPASTGSLARCRRMSAANSAADE